MISQKLGRDKREAQEGQKRRSLGDDGRTRMGECITSPLPCFSLLSPTRLRALICINPAGALRKTPSAYEAVANKIKKAKRVGRML